jgi:hypothetical protein
MCIRFNTLYNVICVDLNPNQFNKIFEVFAHETIVFLKINVYEMINVGDAIVVLGSQTIFFILGWIFFMKQLFRDYEVY